MACKDHLAHVLAQYAANHVREAEDIDTDRMIEGAKVAHDEAQHHVEVVRILMEGNQ